MSLQPPSLDTYTAEGRRELCSRMLPGTETSALIPDWQRGGRRGSATTCLHLSTALLPAPSIWSKGMFHTTFPTSISHRDPTHP